MRPLFLLPLAMMCATSVTNAQTRLYDNEFSLSEVRLLDGPFRHACEMNVDVLRS